MATKRRRKVKKRDYNPDLAQSLVWTMCSNEGCGIEEKVPEGDGLTCSTCTQMKAISLLSETERKSLFGSAQTNKGLSRPRGWRWLAEFVDSDGNVFVKGKEMPELKGTLPVTDVAAIKARQKANKEKRKIADNKNLLKMAAEKKELKKAIEAQKDFLDHKAGK
jgi:hypothetical protein|tara:strand:+ start:3816 stop:4307 length:492 start_codon:yes stop_codon:yes gene_type:complete